MTHMGGWKQKMTMVSGFKASLEADNINEYGFLAYKHFVVIPPFFGHFLCAQLEITMCKSIYNKNFLRGVPRRKW